MDRLEPAASGARHLQRAFGRACASVSLCDRADDDGDVARRHSEYVCKSGEVQDDRSEILIGHLLQRQSESGIKRAKRQRRCLAGGSAA
jgi:hypothetical protein